MRTSLILPVAALLAACSTPQDRIARLQAEMDDMVKTFGPACTQLGYAPQSDPWRNCVLQLSLKDDIERYGYYPSYYAGMGFHHWRRW